MFHALYRLYMSVRNNRFWRKFMIKPYFNGNNLLITFIHNLLQCNNNTWHGNVWQKDHVLSVLTKKGIWGLFFSCPFLSNKPIVSVPNYWTLSRNSVLFQNDFMLTGPKQFKSKCMTCSRQASWKAIIRGN